MADYKDFLVEIGTEELPSKPLKKLSENFRDNILSELKHAQLSHKEVEVFASPRRLALIVKELETAQADQKVERTGPFKNAAFDEDDKPKPAAIGFAKSCGTDIDNIEFQDSDKGPRLYFMQEIKGKAAKDLLPEIVEKALTKLPINKPMRWGNYNAKFIRPVHWVLMLLGKESLEGTLFNKKVGNITYGHRFHKPDAITITEASAYEKALENKGYVLPNFEKRREKIKKQLLECSKNVVIDNELLDEVTGLVEWPIALKGDFDKRFLAVPEEALITSMKVNQKCFVLTDNNKKLLPHFITVSNIDSKNKARVIEGNERVIAARLSDAEFFYQTDVKQGLENNADRLKEVIFQAKLGSMHEKSNRVVTLAKSIPIDKNNSVIQEAGMLAKADLLSDMVNEFPELQGIMGYHYTKDKNKAIALAIKDHYLPRHSGDDLPGTLEGCALSIADKIDTMIGIFGINQAPTGVKDPYGLRRAAIGVLRIIIEKEIVLDLENLLIEAEKGYSNRLENKNVVSDCFNFITDRLKHYYSDNGISGDIFASVAARKPTQLLDFNSRIKAVQNFKNLPEAEALAAANKRVSNILKKQNGNDISTWKINNKLFDHDAERNLAQLIEQKKKTLKKSGYTDALNELASLQKPVDHFFDEVLVMDENIEKRNNRLALLSSLRNLFLQIADISLLQRG